MSTSTFTIELSTRRGCTAKMTFVYQVLETSADIQFVDMTTIQPKSGKKGGCKTYQFLFRCNSDIVHSPASFVKMRKNNLLGERVGDLTYTVNPLNPQPLARLKQIDFFYGVVV